MTAYWPDFFGMKSPADQDPVLYNNIPGSSGLTSPADQDPVLYNIMLAPFFWYEVAC